MKNISDEQVDQMMRTLMADAAVGSEVIDEIADSPSIWWGVQREIRRQDAPAVMPWPPTRNWLRMLLVGVPVTAAGLVIAFLIFGGSGRVDSQQAKTIVEPEKIATDQFPIAAAPVTVPASEVDDTQPSASRSESVVKKAVKQRPPAAIKANTNRPTVKANDETSVRSEFIALSYANNPESGQIVKVKVPSSMMVTLGLVSSVAKPSSLVDAEVVLGDDGLTHSIRFIRKSL